MIIKFTIHANTQYGEGYLFLDNLTPAKNNCGPESLAVGVDNRPSAGVIAHDVIEHSRVHRYSGTICLDNELRAIGASLYVRGWEITSVESEIDMLLGYADRPIKQIPQIVKAFIDKHTDVIPISLAELQEICLHADSETVIKTLEQVTASFYQVAWGFFQKGWQYEQYGGCAYTDFAHVTEVVKKACLKGVFEDSRKVHFNINTDTGESKIMPVRL